MHWRKPFPPHPVQAPALAALGQWIARHLELTPQDGRKRQTELPPKPETAGR